MDLGTGLTVLGTALGGKDIIVKILGPTAEYIGDGLKDFAEKRVNNVKDIFKNANSKLGDKINSEGSIPPKVLRGTLNERSYASDFLSVDYFGGVLASSRSGISRDDRGVFFNALIARLSTYQLRLHYVFYHSIKKSFNGEDINWGVDSERSKMKLYIPYSSFIQAMDFDKNELNNLSIYLDHVINGLLREQLVDNFFQYGNVEHIKKHFADAEESGIILQPNRLGFELFYWAYGMGQESTKTFLDEEKVFELDEKIKLDDRIRKITGVNNGYSK